jgi:uncharacterized integral membrane protein
MQFIKTLFWAILAVVLIVFAVQNWSPVSVLIWTDLRADTKLPVLVIGAFLLGFLPTYMLYRTDRWRLRRRITTLENSLRPAPAPIPSASNPPLDLKGAQLPATPDTAS